MIPAWIVCGLEFVIATQMGYPVVRGALEGNYAYTSGVDIQYKPAIGVYSVLGGGELAILRQDIRVNEKHSVLRCRNNMIGGNSNSLLRWQLIDKRYYCVTHRVFSSEPTARRSTALAAFPLPKLEAIYAHGINEADRQKRYDEFFSSSDHFPFLGTSLAGMEFFKTTDKELMRVFFDLWARGGKNWEVYLAQPHKGNRLTREDYHPGRENRGVEQEKSIWEKVGEWTFDWTGPFYVAASGDDRYFVTDTGRVFATPPRTAKPGAPLKEVWKGPRVEALIHDSDAKKFYAFTKDQYFEVADPIKPRPHTIPIRRAWTADKALEVAAKCGRVIRGLPEPKGK